MSERLIGLTGHMQAGKDTIGKILVEQHGFTRLAFADTLKSMALALNPLIFEPHNEYNDGRGDYYRLRSYVQAAGGWDEAKKNAEVRRFLQVLGTEGVREHISENAWIAALDRQRRALEGNVVVTDVRFPNEAQWVHVERGELWRVHRDGLTGDDHPSEVHIDGLTADVEIINNGTIEELERVVEDALTGVRIYG